MYTIEKLKERNCELKEEIEQAIDAYIASTGLTPQIEIVWHSSIVSTARPIVTVTAEVR